MDSLIWTRGLRGLLLNATVATLAILVPLGLVWGIIQIAAWLAG